MRGMHSPRVRSVILMLLLVICAALTLHLLEVNHHSMAMLDACLAVLVGIVVLIGARTSFTATEACLGERPRPGAHAFEGVPRTRPPPGKGTVLLC